MRKAALFLFTVALLLVLTSCGGQTGGNQFKDPPPPERLARVALSVTDAPPAGVTVLFSDLTIAQATLTNSAGQSVSILSNNGVPVNLSQLQTGSAFLDNGSVAPGTYTGISLTLSGPLLTIYNGTGAAIGSCQSGELCNGGVAISPTSLTFSAAPFPLTLTADSPLALKLDIHLNQIIQPDLTLNLAAANGVTLTQTAPPSTGNPALGTLKGATLNVNTNQFSFQTDDYRTFTLLVDSNTTYDFPSSVCSAEAFSCLATQQELNVQVSLQSDGTLLATDVDYLYPSTAPGFEGTIVGLSTLDGNTVIALALQDVESQGTVGSVTVPNSGVTYGIDSGAFVIPSGLTFAGVSDLRVGQEVLATPQGQVVSGPLPAEGTGWNSAHIDSVSFMANSVTLEPSQITGSVTALNSPGMNFVLTTNPNYFLSPSGANGTPPTATNINVQTTGATSFENLSPDAFSGLAVNGVISVRGWLFASPGAAPDICTPLGGCYPHTTLAAETVLGRPGPTALF